jgi:two-component system sensor histidine kinase YesM
LIIYDSNHQILFSSDANDIGSNIDDIFKKTNEKTIITNCTVGLSGLTVTGIVSENTLYQEINDLRRSQIIMVVIAVLVSMLVATFLYRYYYPRFRVLTDTMQRSDLSIRIPIKSKDEIGLISSAYNKMCDQMQIWIDKQYSTQIQLRTAELHALTAQINPHFIYNTLESIRMQALMDGNEKVSEMLILFGSMFRWAIQSDENIVRLEDELEYISSYLQLQNIRLSNTINICINVDDRFLDCGIPKLVLQPIVENTIIHSKSPELKNTKRLSEIRITVTQSGKDLQIGISDNGPGITIEKLNAIRNSLRESSSLQYSGGIGLKNVHDRLHLMFGSSYGLTIESQESIGTRVSICIPMMSRKEMVDNV